MHNNNIKCTRSRLDMHFVIRRPTYMLYVVTVTKVYVRTYYVYKEIYSCGISQNTYIHLFKYMWKGSFPFQINPTGRQVM